MMKRKKLTASTLAVVLCMGLILAGCSSKEEEPAEEPEPEEPAMQEIGDTSASMQTELTDDLGEAITGLSVKAPEKAAYPANFMAADQQIENGETVKFYYKPQTTTSENTVTITNNSTKAEENEEDKEAALLPDDTAIGYWNMAEDTKEELTIWDVTDDVVTFRLWWEDGPATRDLMVSFNAGNEVTFAGVIGDDSMISGTMTFTETAVTIDIEECDYEGLDTSDGPFVFDEKHAQSWEYADDYKDEDEYDEYEYDEDGENVPEEEQAVETEKNDDSYLLKVTTADDKTYELSSFDIDDMDAVTLSYGDDVAYLTYKSLLSGEEVNTKEQEKAIKKDKEAAQKVIDQISGIIPVESEDEYEDSSYDEEELEEAREAYNELTDAEKEYVSNEASLRWKELSLESPTEEYLEPEPNDTTEEEIIEEDGEDPYSEGYDYGVQGYAEDNAAVTGAANEWAEANTIYANAYDEFWNGYNDGYKEYEASQGKDETESESASDAEAAEEAETEDIDSDD